MKSSLSLSLAVDILKWQTNTRDCMEFDYFPEKAFDAFQLKIANAHAQPATWNAKPKPVCSLMSSLNCILRAKMWNSFDPETAYILVLCTLCRTPPIADCKCARMLARSHTALCFHHYSLKQNRTKRKEKKYTHRQISREPGPCKNVYYSFLIWYLFIFLRAVTGWGYMDDAGPHFNFSN